MQGNFKCLKQYPQGNTGKVVCVLETDEKTAGIFPGTRIHSVLNSELAAQLIEGTLYTVTIEPAVIPAKG